MGHNNPSKLAYDEVEARHHGEVLGVPIQMLLNIGTGRQGSVSNSTENGDENGIAQPTGLRRYLRYITGGIRSWTDDRDVVHDFRRLARVEQSRMKYFRFDVENGLQDMKMDEWKKNGTTLNTIMECTREYLSSEVVQEELKKAANKLVAARNAREVIWKPEKQAVFALAWFNYDPTFR